MSQNPSNLNALTPKVTADNGSPFAGLLQPAHQVALIPDATATTTYTTYVAGTINGIIDALVAVGIMKSS